MADSLFDILQNRNFDEPPEATAIKKYCMDTYRKSVAVQVREKDIVITVQGPAFANALRMRWKQLQRAADTDKRLIFKIA
ncbi:MAG TPA: hypothetical protein VK978_01260 [Candidatus Saccharimonadales bacterium]|nr:hypothetical protein [Candidatus Saccharimonadales bacterium]